MTRERKKESHSFPSPPPLPCQPLLLFFFLLTHSLDDLTSLSPHLFSTFIHHSLLSCPPCQAHLVLPSAILFSFPSPVPVWTWAKPNKARYLGERPIPGRPPRQVPYGLMSMQGSGPWVRAMSQFITARCWGVICCFIPSVCTMGPFVGSEQRPLEFRSNALTSCPPYTQSTCVPAPDTQPAPTCSVPARPSPHPPHSPTRRMATAGEDGTRTGACKMGPRGTRSLWPKALSHDSTRNLDSAGFFPGLNPSKIWVSLRLGKGAHFYQARNCAKYFPIHSFF